jgi:hypothetical protein
MHVFMRNGARAFVSEDHRLRPPTPHCQGLGNSRIDAIDALDAPARSIDRVNVHDGDQVEAK